MSTDKVALITGANKGIGLETARQLAQKNITVLVGARDLEKGEEAVAELKKEGLDARAIAIDVNDSTSIRKAAAQVEKDFGKLDILVNNAGVMLDDDKKKLSEQSLETWRKTFETNLFGLIETTQTFLPLLRKSEAGRIVNFSSILGSTTYHATPGSPVYMVGRHERQVLLDARRLTRAPGAPRRCKKGGAFGAAFPVAKLVRLLRLRLQAARTARIGPARLAGLGDRRVAAARQRRRQRRNRRTG